MIELSIDDFLGSFDYSIRFIKEKVPILGSRPKFRLTIAADFLRIPNARMIGEGMRSVSRAMSKF